MAWPVAVTEELRGNVKASAPWYDHKKALLATRGENPYLEALEEPVILLQRNMTCGLDPKRPGHHGRKRKRTMSRWEDDEDARATKKATTCSGTSKAVRVVGGARSWSAEELRRKKKEVKEEEEKKQRRKKEAPMQRQKASQLRKRKVQEEKERRKRHGYGSGSTTAAERE